MYGHSNIAQTLFSSHFKLEERTNNRKQVSWNGRLSSSFRGNMTKMRKDLKRRNKAVRKHHGEAECWGRQKMVLILSFVLQWWASPKHIYVARFMQSQQPPRCGLPKVRQCRFFSHQHRPWRAGLASENNKLENKREQNKQGMWLWAKLTLPREQGRSRHLSLCVWMPLEFSTRRTEEESTCCLEKITIKMNLGLSAVHIAAYYMW